MRNNFTWILLTIIYHGVISTVDFEYVDGVNCVTSKRLENQCASYCYKAVKPFLQLARESQQKDAKIAELTAQLTQLRSELLNEQLLEISANIDDIKKSMYEMKSGGNLQNQSQNEQNSQNAIRNGLKLIKVPGLEEFLVPFDDSIAGPEWIIVQQRFNGKQSFYLNWDAYREGFGDIDQSGEFFIGLRKLHHMLSNQPHELYIWMEQVNKIVRYAHYDNFNVGDENSSYKLLSLGNFSGNSTDALRRNENMKFTTFDRDNDKHISSNCARIQNDGWWHAACSDSNLNGIYNDAMHCIYWYYPKLQTNGDCLESVKILIRPKKSSN